MLAQALDARVRMIRNDMGTSYGVRSSTVTLGGGTAVLYIEGTVETAGLSAALRLIRSAVSGSKELTRAEFDHGRWAVARAFNLNLATATDWVRGALYVGRQGWDLATVDDAPRVLSSIDRSRLVASLRRCADEGVLSIVGDETVVRRAIAEAWK